MIETDWQGCYGDGWQGLIVPEAFAHPAKFSRALIRRIFEHLAECGWVSVGDRVVDPFGGVALGALDAMRLGLHWTGCELEQKFVDLGTQNIAQWNRRFSGMPHWGTARLVQGDSRELASVVGKAECAVSSPPYACITKNLDDIDNWDETKANRIRDMQAMSRSMMKPYSTSPSNLGNMREGAPPVVADYAAAVSSPPYAEAQAHPSIGSVNKDDWGKDGHDITARRGLSADYGTAPGQLGAMREGNFDATVSSPPFSNSETVALPRERIRDTSDPHQHGSAGPDYVLPRTSGQLAAMREGAFEAAVSSPPWENQIPSQADAEWHQFRGCIGSNNSLGRGDYGDAPGQLGQTNGDTFWSAARAIVEQTHAILRPGAHAVWVVKSYVKGGQRVPFPERWQALCESVGFRTLHWHRAWLVEDRGTQHTIFGEVEQRKRARKSFFRLLAERKGAPPIDYEIVLCQEKI